MPSSSRCRSETRYRRLFKAAQDGMFILDADTGQIADVNPFLIKMLGHSREEFVGKKLWEMGPFRNIEASKAAFAKLIKDNLSGQSESLEMLDTIAQPAREASDLAQQMLAFAGGGKYQPLFRIMAATWWSTVNRGKARG